MFDLLYNKGNKYSKRVNEMGKVYQKVLNQFEKNPRGFQEDLGKLAGYASGSNFKKALTEGRDIEKLDGFIKVIEKLFPENSYDLLVEYAKELDAKKMTIRLLLEYVTLYHMEDMKLLILNKLKDDTKSESKEWVHVYETDHLIEKGEISPFDGINLLNSKKYSKIETGVYSKIAQIYCYYDMKNIYMLNLFLEQLENEVSQIKNSFLRNAYEGRIFRIKVDINLHTDKIGSLLESSFNLENAIDATKTMVYLQLGNSYMMKSYDKSMKYLNKALECKNSRSESEIKQSINFVNLLWDKPENFICDGTTSNELFYYIKCGNKSEALRLLEKINFEELNNHQKAFNMFYQGLLHGDKSCFYKSIEYFNTVGEKYYKQLPILELRKKGENEMILSALSA
jgi:hypothetical protein